jgi:hypothetical protein
VTFTTVFDAAQQRWQAWWFPAFGLIFVALGALLILMPELMQRLLPRGLQGRARYVFSWVYFLFALLWTGFAFSKTLQEYETIKSVLNDGRYSVVEGPVTNFVPMPDSGHGLESFTIDRRRFSYSDYIVTFGFNKTASHGGPIREGLYVRITYYGDLILRLEVAQQT